MTIETKGVRLYGKKDLRLENFTLPSPKEDQILAKVISDSICMSSYKASEQGIKHKRVPSDVAENPIIIGHEFCGEIIEVGKKWQHAYKPGQKFSIQPAINDPNGPVGLLSAPGYSYPTLGGDTQHVIVPNIFMEKKCLLPYNTEAYYLGSIAEPMSCIIGTFHANYHTTPGSYVHEMGIKENGTLAILAGVGPMGLGAIDYAIHCDRKPGLLVVTDIDSNRLARAENIFPVEEAARNGVDLRYINTSEPGKDTEYLKSLTEDGKGYDDVMVFAPVRQLIEQAGELLTFDGCLNFFAGPTVHNFPASLNFYNIHYGALHVVGTSGGNTDDMLESLRMMEEGKINPSTMITHVGGLDSAVETTLTLPKIPGGKKLIYTHISMPLTALLDLAEKGKTDPMMASLAEIVDNNNGIWCTAAEEYLLANAPKV